MSFLQFFHEPNIKNDNELFVAIMHTQFEYRKTTFGSNLKIKIANFQSFLVLDAFHFFMEFLQFLDQNDTKKGNGLCKLFY